MLHKKPPDTIIMHGGRNNGNQEKDNETTFDQT